MKHNIVARTAIFLFCLSCNQPSQNAELKDHSEAPPGEQALLELISQLESDINKQARFQDEIQNVYAKEAFRNSLQTIIDERINGPKGLRALIRRLGNSNGGGGGNAEWANCLMAQFPGISVALAPNHGLNQQQYCIAFANSLRAYFVERPGVEQQIRNRSIIVFARAGKGAQLSGTNLFLNWSFQFEELDEAILPPLPSDVFSYGGKVWHFSTTKEKFGGDFTYCINHNQLGTINWREANNAELSADLFSKWSKAKGLDFVALTDGVGLARTLSRNEFEVNGYNFLQNTPVKLGHQRSTPMKTICVGERSGTNALVRSSVIPSGHFRDVFFVSQTQVTFPEAKSVCDPMGAEVSASNGSSTIIQLGNEFPILRQEKMWVRENVTGILMSIGQMSNQTQGQPNERAYFACYFSWLDQN